jgi:lipopolysaccharide transport system ATP-binding protein
LRDVFSSAVVSPLRRFAAKITGSSNDINSKDESIYALKDVSFDVKKGDVVGIIGRNGAGKSTLLKILSRITEPTSGYAEIRGRVGSLLEVGTGFHPELTGRDNIYLNGAILGMKKAEIERRFDEIVAFSELEKFLDTPVKHYSSGMYVRLAFAVAAHLEPEILLLDEVLAVGDIAFQRKCFGKIGTTVKEGRTVVLVAHQMDAIKAHCNSCVLLQNGKVLSNGETTKVVSDYLETLEYGEDASLVEVPEDPELDAQILSGKLMNSKGEAATRFEMFEPISLEVEYIIRKPCFGLIIGFEINKDRSPIFFSYDTDTNPSIAENRKQGRYKSLIDLPCPLLKSGKYSVTFVALIPGRKLIHLVENPLFFQIDLVSKDQSMLSYSPGRPGIVATPLNWKTKTME